MKSFTLFASTFIIALALTAFTLSNWNGSDHNLSCQATIEIEPPTFFYNLSPRGGNTMSKERMHNAKTISDLIPDFGLQQDLNNKILSVRDVSIRIEEENVEPSKHRSEKGNGNTLSKEQISLLQSTDYSTNFFLEGYFTDNPLIKDVNKDRHFNYYMSVVPEQQASYKAGNNAFLHFLKTECQSTISKVKRGNLKFGNISFIVTKDGNISNINLVSTCGYPEVDDRMVELMNKLPDNWNVATNDKGEKVNQTLFFSFGQGGC